MKIKRRILHGKKNKIKITKSINKTVRILNIFPSIIRMIMIIKHSTEIIPSLKLEYWTSSHFFRFAVRKGT